MATGAIRRTALPDGQAVTFMDNATGTTRTVRDPEVIRRLDADNQHFRDDEPAIRRSWTTRLRESAGRSDSEQVVRRAAIGLGYVRAFRGTNDVSLFQQARPAVNANVAAESNDGSDLPLSLAATLRIDAADGMRGTAWRRMTRTSIFANLLVPGVGLAPVTEFHVLITLFVLVIGPVNYWLLKRWRRLHLMVLTVPLAAALGDAGAVRLRDPLRRLRHDGPRAQLHDARSAHGRGGLLVAVVVLLRPGAGAG